jgi:hypothetical protein
MQLMMGNASGTIKKIGLATLFLVLTSVPAHAGSQIFSNLADFQAVLDGNAYFENFDSLTPGLLPNSLNFSNGLYSYTVTTGLDRQLFGICNGTCTTNSDVYLSTNAASDSIVITFTGSPVTDIGGDFFPTGAAGGLDPGNSVEVTLSDGTVIVVTAGTDPSQSFVGFEAPEGESFTSLTVAIDPPQGGVYATVNNLYVDSPAPEPGTIILLTAGLGALKASRKKGGTGPSQ